MARGTGRDGPVSAEETEFKTRGKPQPALSLPQIESLVGQPPSMPRRLAEMFTCFWFPLGENGAGLWRGKPRDGPYSSQHCSET